MKPCPKCGSAMSKRVRRPVILKLIPGSKRFKCAMCKKFFTWFSPVELGIML